MTKTVVALYDSHDAVNRAVNELVNNGFARDDISILTPNAEGEYVRETSASMEESAAQGAGVGAGLGAALGGLGGLLVGLGALTIPGVGPVLAAGPLATALTGLAGAGVGAIAGGVTGGLLGTLIDLGIPEERAHYYAEGVRRGGTLLVVSTTDDRTRDAVDIINRQHPIDLNQRAEEWRQGGWSKFDASSPAYYTGRSGAHADEDPIVPGMATSAVPPVTGAHINDGRKAHTDDPAVAGMARSAKPPLTGTPLEDGRESYAENPVVGGMASSATPPLTGTPEDTGYGSDVFPYDEKNPVVGGMARGADADLAAFERYESEFEDYFNRSPYSATYSYTEYRPAYIYGYGLAYDDRYRGRQWTEIEPDANRYWDERHPGTWERFKDSIRHAWERFKDAVD